MERQEFSWIGTVLVCVVLAVAGLVVYSTFLRSQGSSTATSTNPKGETSAESKPPLPSDTSSPPPRATPALTAKAESYSRIVLTWKNFTPRAKKVDIQRSTRRDGDFKSLAIQDVEPPSFKDDKGLEPEKVYYYQVCVGNEAGWSAFSSVASAMTGEAPPPPPRNLVATPPTGSDARVELTWKNGADDDRVTVERSPKGGKDFQPLAEQPTVRDERYTDRSVSWETEYVYRVRANTANGKTSEYSPEVTVRLPEEPRTSVQAPKDLKAVQAEGPAAQVKLTWTNGAKDDRVTVERSPKGGEDFQPLAHQPRGGAPSYTDRGVSWDEEYVYRVRATANGKTSEYSNLATVIIRRGLPPQGDVLLIAVETPGLDKDTKVLGQFDKLEKTFGERLMGGSVHLLNQEGLTPRNQPAAVGPKKFDDATIVAAFTKAFRDVDKLLPKAGRDKITVGLIWMTRNNPELNPALKNALKDATLKVPTTPRYFLFWGGWANDSDLLKQLFGNERSVFLQTRGADNLANFAVEEIGTSGEKK